MVVPVRACASQHASCAADRVEAGGTDDGWRQMQALAAVAAQRPHPPRQGTMTGTANGGTVSLEFDRNTGTTLGSVGGRSVSLVSDANAGTTSGQANGSPVSLQQQWTPERIVVDGQANGKRLHTDIDWEAGRMTGSNGSAGIDLRFDLRAGEIDGTVGGRDVSLQFEPISGRLTGTMNGRPLDLTIVNRGLDQFLQNLYLFMA